MNDKDLVERIFRMPQFFEDLEQAQKIAPELMQALKLAKDQDSGIDYRTIGPHDCDHRKAVAGVVVRFPYLNPGFEENDPQNGVAVISVFSAMEMRAFIDAITCGSHLLNGSADRVAAVIINSIRDEMGQPQPAQSPHPGVPVKTLAA